MGCVGVSIALLAKTQNAHPKQTGKKYYDDLEDHHRGQAARHSGTHEELIAALVGMAFAWREKCSDQTEVHSDVRLNLSNLSDGLRSGNLLPELVL